MWALRRASVNFVKIQGLNLATLRTFAGLGPFSNHTEDRTSSSVHHGFTHNRWITSSACECTQFFAHQFSCGRRSLSSQAGAKSGGEEDDDLEAGFSELDTPETTVEGDEDSDNSSESESESDVSNVNVNGEENLESELMKGVEVDAEEKVSKKKVGPSPLFKLLLDVPVSSLSNSLDKYAKEEGDFSRDTVYDAMLNLRRRKMFLKALQLSEWLEKREDFDFTDRDYASRVDLIAKMRGLWKAENYVDTIPKSHRQEVVYRTLLANCVSTTNVAKAEEIFNRMKDLDFVISAFACNQLLLLYKRTDKKKIADVLLLMEKEDIKPTSFTYELLIDAKGQANDIVGMEQIFVTMQAEGIDPGTGVLATLARHYTAGGLKEKAEEVLKKMEGDDLKSNREVCPILLRGYADLRKADDIERVWKVCESNTRSAEYLAAIEAWGKLKNVKKAEAVFTEMTKSVKRLAGIHYCTILKVYAENKMLSEGKELIKQMGDSGCFIGPLAWDALVKLYVDAGEVEKADSILQKATEKNQQKPLFNTYMVILDQYAKRGDVHNAEKVFQKMRQYGYLSRARPFQSLLNAYIMAKVPAYGFRERLKADNIFPNRQLAGQLAQVDAFKKNAASDLLD